MPSTSGSSYRPSSNTSSTRRPPATTSSTPYVPGFSSYAAGNPSPQLQTQQIYIPNDLVGCIIGKGGSKINEIRHMSASQIKIMEPGAVGVSVAGAPAPTGGEGERLVVITGQPANIQMAVQLLYHVRIFFGSLKMSSNMIDPASRARKAKATPSTDFFLIIISLMNLNLLLRRLFLFLVLNVQYGSLSSLSLYCYLSTVCPSSHSHIYFPQYRTTVPC